MGLSVAQRLAALSIEDRTKLVRSLPDDVVEEMVRGEWWYTARPEQIPPPGDWMISLYLAGRGAGKSRSGSEWIVDQVLKHPVDRHGASTEWFVIAETLADARLICLEGPSGILRVLERKKIQYRYKQAPKPMLMIGGSRIHTLGADDEDVARGANAAGAWLDEVAKWYTPYESWYHGIMPALRADLIDDHPRAFITTTPKPIKLLLEWLDRTDGSIHIITGSTFDNASNLSPHVLRELRTRYAGTAIGEQELYGKMLNLGGGSVFKREHIARDRVEFVPDNLTVVVGMDPNLTGEDDEAGIIVVGRSRDNRLYVIADRSVSQTGRTAAMAAWRAVADYNAELLVVEENLGKQYLKEVLRDAYTELVEQGVFPKHTSPPLKAVHSKHGKKTRAEPVGMRSEQGKLHFVNRMDTLEDQMVLFDPDDRKESPDRMDALVHACLHLMNTEGRRARMSDPASHNLPMFDLSTGYDIGPNIYST